MINCRSKGQVIVATGIVIALSFYLVYVAADFASVGTGSVKSQESRIMENMAREILRTYEESAQMDPVYRSINEDMEKFASFSSENLQPMDVNFLISVGVHYNGSHIKSGVKNMLGRSISAEINGTECSNHIEHGEECSVELSEHGDRYILELFYEDIENNQSRTVHYGGLTGADGNHTSLFYTIEVGGSSLELVMDGNASTRSME